MDLMRMVFSWIPGTTAHEAKHRVTPAIQGHRSANPGNINLQYWRNRETDEIVFACRVELPVLGGLYAFSALGRKPEIDVSSVDTRGYTPGKRAGYDKGHLDYFDIYSTATGYEYDERGFLAFVETDS